MKKAPVWIALAAAGGSLYCLIELIWRGRTHPSMFIVGGAAFILIDSINEIRSDMPLVWQMVASSAIVTAVEFISGLFINVWLCLGVWDYSNLPGNILGQICPQFTIAWCFLSLPAIFLADFLRQHWFGETMPEYKFF